jgi:toxin FitB
VIILDTNVLSELTRRTPAPEVIDWLDRQPPESVWTTSVCLFEIDLGLALMPEGQRRDTIRALIDRMIDEHLEGRVLPFDRPAAEAAAGLHAARQRAGRPIDFRDTQIAGIVLARKATLATRNLRHFEDLATRVVNPWLAEQRSSPD